MAGKQHGLEARYLEADGIDTDQSSGLAWRACIVPPHSRRPLFQMLGLVTVCFGSHACDSL